MTDSANITKELAKGKFTDKMLDDMRALIGTQLRTEACLNNEYATRLAILRFCEGIGDDNPLWTDAEYAAKSPLGTLVAPPSFIFACLGSVQVGWPGLGGFHCETKLTFDRYIRVGDKITAKVTFDGFDGPTDDSNFGGRRIKDYLRQEYRNQDDELVATFICSRMRFERGEMQKRAATRAITVPHPWTEAEIAAIEEAILAERPRGATPRYWDDVQPGDEIDVITKGPLGLTDFIAFIAAGAAPIPRISAHGVALRRYRKHPKWAFRDPKTHALEPVYSVHYNDYAAQLQGAQIAYDVGIQRTSWQTHSLTHWMGDAGFLKASTSQYRAHVYLGDVVRLGGRVEAKEIDADGQHVVRLTTWAYNQREQNVMPGTAVIVLPVRGAADKA
ncbi:FAS1-like dehydratase domain-containing protein [Cupriavidus alkaliphilus]|uniref:FAS1-like dehydratase domain-containing protein n=1 Tax=Cupriavidus alkaliphilus TaxID=942866 RepID=UPI00161F1845|nr:MaoC family dehydratase N-terminal domain-containing protein [Cupriavidus alkaliphilus]MBB3014114.1 acyl dehydratase [Cupriavidus alkaliphilus]